ncbi:helix-turn-helix transcriptional regulator [Nocardia sp. NPDC020380]|uniref:helix-turn-helix transcriptional regulator n=1 Tax=Nocardia sp. NPDC020380 TaxID=3364309 RepID=UPI0037AAE80F
MSANRLGEFLRARRVAAKPAPDPPQQRRRTPGLRREEVAARAAISADYYTRLEQGRERHPSARVLDALATALELSTAEAAYLHGLVTPLPTTQPAADDVPNEFLLLVMRSWTLGPAYIVNHRSDVLAANVAAHQLFEHFEISDNILRMLFLDPAARRLWADWDVLTRHLVSGIRRMIGPTTDIDPATTLFIADVSRRSPEFAALWNSHEMGVYDRKEKKFHHEDLGEIELDFELLTTIDSQAQYLVLHRTPRRTG